MSTISSIPSWNPLPVAAPDYATNRAQAAWSAAALSTAASTVVTLSAGGMAATATAGLARNWESPPGDAVSTQMARNFSATSTEGRFKGLGAALLNQLKLDGKALSQALQLAPPDAALPATALHGFGDDQFSLNVTTKSGALVTLALDSQGDGLAVQMSSSAQLSETERGALGGLAAAFQDAIDGMTQQPPEMLLGGLTQFDGKLLASVDLRASVTLKTDPPALQTLDFHADSARRSVSFSGAAGAARVDVDLSRTASLGSAQQQAKALGSYLAQFDQAASRGHGDAALMTLFKDAFASMNSNLPGAPQPLAGAAEPDKWALAVEDRAALSGLADFSAAVTQHSRAGNPMRAEEKDSFAYQAAQTTSVAGRSEDERSVSQRQTSELSASYHMPITPGTTLRLDMTQESQNYDYFQINDAASSNVELAYHAGHMLKATLAQTATQTTRVMRYMLGHLTSDTTTPVRQTLQRDLLATLAPPRGDASQTADEAIAQRQRQLAGVGPQVLLQAYPDPADAAWSRNLAGPGTLL